ncbi:MAG TPA: FHA domain-containing protein [Kofleriaceae bacterium]|nr:FHA domain-containing protein [Kofleriaceae bacterium]
MRSWLAVVGVIALALAIPARAHANPTMQRVVIDRVELAPSPVLGYARMRLFVNAVDLSAAGKPMDVFGGGAWKLQISGDARQAPYLAGLYSSTDTDTAVVVIVETHAAYTQQLGAIKSAIDQELLAKLPAKTQVAVIGYGGALTGSSRLGSIKAAQQALAQLAAEETPEDPSLLVAIDKALAMLKKAKTEPEGRPVRKLIVLVSDGVDKNNDRDKVTGTGKKALAQGVRIDPIAFYEDQVGSKGPLLNLGELAKQSAGTFRWAQNSSSIAARIDNVALEIDHQYVLTYLVAPDDVAGKKISIVAQVSASQAIESNDVKVPATPTCASNECPEDGYCAADACVKRAQPKGTSIVSIVLIIVAVGVGLLGVLFVVGIVIQKARKPKAPPGPGMPIVAPPPGAPAPAAAPAPPAPVAGPQLYFMTGPRTGERIGLRHGFLIGKQPGCDIVLDQDGFASSQHAQILMDQAGNCTLIDKGSTNGTFVNGVRVSQYALTHGVAIRVGSTELRFLAQ